MNDNRFGGELHAWIEPELEARLVALILGEASDFEAEELERLMQERPELRIFKRRLEVVHSLLGEAVRPPDAEKWRMAPERRAALMKAIGLEVPEEPVVVPIDAGRERRVRRAGLRVAVMAAACLLISLLLVPFLLRGTKSAWKGGADFLAAEPADAEMKTLDPGFPPELMEGTPAPIEWPPGSGQRAGGSSVGDKLAALKQNLGTDTDGRGEMESGTISGERFSTRSGVDSTVKLESLAVRRGGVLEKKAEPSSATAKVIAATTPAPVAIPVPEVEVPEPSTEFGTADNFGDGWGSGGGGGSFGNGRGSGRTAESKKSKPGQVADVPTPVMPGEPPARPKSAPAKPAAPATPAPGDVPIMGRLFAKDGSQELAQEGEVPGGSGHWNRSKSERESRSTVKERPMVEVEELRRKTRELAARGERVMEEKGRLRERLMDQEGRERDERSGQADGYQSEKDRKLSVQTKSVEVTQANSEELKMDWTVEDEAKKADSNGAVVGGGAIVYGRGNNIDGVDVSNPGQGGGGPNGVIPVEVDGGVGGVVTGGLRSGDAAITRNSIDAILNNPTRSEDQPDAPGVLSITGLASSDGQQKMIERGLAQAREKPVQGNRDGVDVSNPGQGAGGPNGMAEGGLNMDPGEVSDEKLKRKTVTGYENNYSWRGAADGKELQDKDGDRIEDVSRVDSSGRGPTPEDGAALSWFDRQAGQNERRGLERSEGEGKTLDDSTLLPALQKPAEGPAGTRGSIVEQEMLRRQSPGGGEAMDDPVRTSAALSVEHARDVDKVSKELYTGEGYYNLGKFEEAKKHFDKVLKTDPYNKAARQWKERVKNAKSDYYRAAYDETRAQLLAEVDEAWEQAVPPVPGGDEPGSPLAGGQASMTNKLDAIVIPKIDFENTTVEEAMDFLRLRTRELDVELDPARKGVNFVVRQQRTEGLEGIDAELDAEVGLGGGDPGAATIKDLKMENVTLRQALEAIGDQAGMRVKQDEFAVTMVPVASGEGSDTFTRRWTVPPSFLKDIQDMDVAEGGAIDPFAPDAGGSLGAGLEARRPIVDVLKDQGLQLPPGASATFLAGSNTLVVNSVAEDHDVIDAIVKAVGDGSPPVDYKGLYEPPTEVGIPEEDPRDVLVANKLNSTIIPSVDFDGITVEEAVEFLRQRSVELDSVSQVDRGVDFAIRKARIDPLATGIDAELDAEAGLAYGDPGTARIGEAKLRNVPLGTVLQYVADQAALRYKIENGRVTLLPVTSGEGADPVTKVWKLHPDVLRSLREEMSEHAAGGDIDPFAPEESAQDSLADSLSQMTVDRRELVEILKDCGISFPPGTSVAYLPNSQTLVVKNMRYNLELVDVLMEQTAAKLAAEKQAEKTNEKHALQEAFSTFSLHVSDVSFKLAQAALARGEWPEAERIRVEEFVNAFDYGDPAPSQDEKVACALEQAVHPFMQQRNMLRISMRTAAVGRAAGTPLRLTVLLDNSGSMERSDRAESVQRAFELLAAQMNPQDEVTLISFARQPRLLRDSVPGNKVAELVNIIRDTPSEGGTNLEEALKLGVEKAQEDFLEGAQNRIILLTDGAANLGNAEPELLGSMVEKMRQQGIAFDACGVGADGLNDDVLEALTRKGDGRYYFLDRPEDADAGFAKQIAGALRPAAKNVKVQVEFNPKRVGHYRLYGFEKHELKKEDFRDDSVDAAEMAAEEAGVAMYQVETLPDGEGDVGSVSVRFMDMATGEMVEKRWPIPYEANPARLEEALPSMKLAASAAFLGEKLKATPVGELVELGDLSGVSRSLQPIYPSDARVAQLIEMIEKAREMGR